MVQTYAYWISTAMLSLLYLSSAGLYLARRDYVREVLRGLGYHAALATQNTAREMPSPYAPAASSLTITTRN
ncbi:hypothetical protein [Sphingobium yanoikuyae]|uniref:hypothetical protein n=1 Tax=Sphingobium yanoikuyae TaxID=13690 RepID=UPI002FDED668